MFVRHPFDRLLSAYKNKFQTKSEYMEEVSRFDNYCNSVQCHFRVILLRKLVIWNNTKCHETLKVFAVLATLHKHEIDSSGP